VISIEFDDICKGEAGRCIEGCYFRQWMQELKLTRLIPRIGNIQKYEVLCIQGTMLITTIRELSGRQG
jgi:hypothetical protein